MRRSVEVFAAMWYIPDMSRNEKSPEAPDGNTGSPENSRETVADGTEHAPSVRHEGKFVLTRAGNKDFGEITPEIARTIGRQPGKIRLETGFHTDSTGRGFGENHIERARRIKELRQNGFCNARDFVETVSASFDAVHKGTGASLILSMGNAKNRNIVYIELTPCSDGDYWTVKSGLIAHEGYLKNKPLLWNKADSSG